MKNYIKSIFKIFLVLSIIFNMSAFAQKVEVDKRIPKYKKDGNVSGNAGSIGSDTMNNLMTLWLEGLKQY